MYAFAYCRKVLNITIGNGVTYIGYMAFYAGAELASVKIMSTNPPTLGSQAFDACSVLTQIIVPKGCSSTYKAATTWSKYADIIVEG